MGRKATVKSLEFPEMTVQVVGNTAIVRHLWVSQTELEGKVTDTKIGVMQVWQKQDGGWKFPGARLVSAAATGIAATGFSGRCRLPARTPLLDRQHTRDPAQDDSAYSRWPLARPSGGWSSHRTNRWRKAEFELPVPLARIRSIFAEERGLQVDQSGQNRPSVSTEDQRFGRSARSNEKSANDRSLSPKI